MDTLRLYMVMLGCKPNGRYTEQHDIFFGIAKSLKELVPHMYRFWPDGGELHIDAWREVTTAGKFDISIISKSEINEDRTQLFFINLGGYKPDEFEEYHYKTVIAANSLAEATKISKQSTFYKHCGFKGATSHIDDKYGIDVDDAYKIEDILPKEFSELYSINVASNESATADQLHIGYVKFSKL